MILGPVFRHELRAAGRKRRYFHARVAIGLLLLLVLWMVFETASFDSARFDDGRLSISGASYVSTTFFQWFAWLTLWGVLLVTPAVAAGGIASERQRRTIEYLFATDLSNGEIVLDKLCARLLTVGKLLLATLPVLAIFRLLGGVPGELLVAHFLLLAATAAVAGSLALCVGAYCERARDAVPRALGWTLAWLVAAPLGSGAFWLIDRYCGPAVERLLEAVLAPIVWFAYSTNPVFVQIRASGFGAGVLGLDFDLAAVATSIGAMLALAAALMTLCALVVRRVHLRSAGLGTGASKPGAASKPAKLRTPYRDWPLLWKEMHAASLRTRPRTWRGKAARVIGYLFFLGVTVTPVLMFWSAFWTIRGRSMFGGRLPDLEDYLVTTSTIGATLGSLVALAAGARASGLITGERERDTWLSLLTTPRSGAEILYAKLLGNLWAFRWPAALLVAMPALGVVLGPAALIAAAATAVSLAIAGAAATAIGLAISLRCGSSTKASTLTVFALLGLSGLYPMFAALLLAMARAGEDPMLIFVAPAVVPWLLGVAPMFAVESLEAEAFLSVAIGLTAYAAIAYIVATASAYDFDRACERGASAKGEPPAAESATT